MLRFIFIIVLLASWGGEANAQFENFSDKPVEITSDGDTRFENGKAIADINVQIYYNGVAIYADHAEYNPDTRDILLLGNVRIYSGKNLFNGERVLYNLETKQTQALQFDLGHTPMKLSALGAQGLGTRQFTLSEGNLTTSDSSMPSWHVHAKTIRIYTDDRVIMLNSTLYVGKIPVMWLPYSYASLNQNGVQFTPGYYSSWGAYLLTAYTFPLGNNDSFLTTIRNDYRSEHGYAVGFNTSMKFGKNDENVGKFLVYYTHDKNPAQFKDLLPATDNNNRYRIGFQQKIYLLDDFYSTFDITRLSDANFMQDFYPAENLYNPQPDNNISLTKLTDLYAASLVTRWQMNNFQETTQRKPEFAIDFKNEPFLGLPVFYDGTTTLGELNRSFSSKSQTPSIFPSVMDYGATRFDTFHQLNAPINLFGWLSAIPTLGIRGTYYNQENNLPSMNTTAQPSLCASSPFMNCTHMPSTVFRPIFNASLENSFKISKSFEEVQSRCFGLDGLRHVLQPYSNLSYVNAGGVDASQVLQFDRLLPNNSKNLTKSGYSPSSTQLEPLQFPQFGAIDAIDTWAIWRLGMHNRLQTRRDGETYDWLSLDTFADMNGINPYMNGPISNLNDRITFAPVSWLKIKIDSQVPMNSDGFTEFNTDFDFMPVRNFRIGIGTRYINNYMGAINSNQYPLNVFWRMNDHWSISAQEIYNTQPGQPNSLIYERYLINRDLSSWIMSLGVQIYNNTSSTTQNAQSQYGAIISFTLKDLPQITLPLAFAPSAGNGAKNTSATPLYP